MGIKQIDVLHLTKNRETLELHHHDCGLIFLSEGKCRIQVTNQTQNLRGGDLYFKSPADQPVLLIDEANPQARLITVQWTDDPSLGEMITQKLIHDSLARYHVTLNWMYDHWLAYGEDRHQICEHLLRALLGEMKITKGEDHEEMDLIQRVIKLMQNNLAGNLSVEDFALAVGMSESHLSRLFRASTGIPPMKYLQQLRLEKAAQLLRNTDLPLKSIAPQVGFRNEFYLSTLIKRHLGSSPRDLRRKRPKVSTD